MNYVRQIPPFNRYLNASTPRKYWEKTGLHEDANIMGYLGVKLFSVNPNSMAEERTVSNLAKLNSPDRARQKTSTLIAMTQVKQHELRLKSTAEDVPGPAIRFRDLSDLIKDSRQTLPNSRQDGGLASAEGTGAAADAPTPLDPEGGHITDRFEEPDTWEQDIGLDEVIERPELGSGRVFEVTERDGINLNALTLLDLLSDEPVDGAIEPATSSTTKKTVNTSKDLKDKEKLSVAQFEF
ncbi:unnamed protein product [Rhizoctonia solani]|uniref:Uncharacterized protein n=1 Tax=Rhizoctonia solani TaxID=456999 RepID=A0A8H3B2Z5_9AGAM|nr:unnamed protein product [Rhizoctonia solani]